MVPLRSLVLGLALSLTLASCRSVGPDLLAPARAALAEGRHADAAAAVETALDGAPRDAALRREAAAILAAADEPDRAEALLEDALQESPEDPSLWIALGELERGRGDLPDAYGAFRRAAQLAPADVRAVSGWALAAEALGLREEADRAYARWAEIEAGEGADAR